MKEKIVAVLSLFVVAFAYAGEKPNIVLVMADDLGLGDLGYHVRTQMKAEPLYETPVIDSLAEAGMWFTDGHSATALCAPTRYCVMTGNNNYRSYAPWGVWSTFAPSAFRDGEATVGSVVKDAGYNTGFIGKWHLGGDFLDPRSGEIYRGPKNGDLRGHVDMSKFLGHGPKYCGFDYDFTLPCGVQGSLYLAYENEEWYPLDKDSEITYFNKDIAINPKDVSDKGPGMGDSHWKASEIGKLISQKAVDFIERSSEKDEPFFLYYCSPTVHLPHCPPDEFDGKKIKGETPSRHLDMVLDLDQQMNRIINALKATGTYENTLFVFTSDNGGLQVDDDTANAGHNSSGLMAGTKNTPEEGGHRVPFFAVWPGHIEPGVTDEPAINTDFVATFAALVGTDIPEGQAMDSNNLLPLLTGKGEFKQRDYIILQAGSHNELIYRKEGWKLIIQSNNKLTKFDPIALYDLNTNLYEKESGNMIDNPEYKEKIDRMLKEYLEIRNSGAPTVSR